MLSQDQDGLPVLAGVVGVGGVRNIVLAAMRGAIKVLLRDEINVQGKTVNVITEPKGWILYHLAEELVKRLPYVMINGPAGRCAIEYFIPYYLYQRRPQTVAVAFFTHCEEGKDERSLELQRRFVEVARSADWCVSMNRMYAKSLRQAGVAHVEVIPPGVDLSIFTPKLLLGWLGRNYWSGRKNEEFVRRLDQFNWIEICRDPVKQHWSVIGESEGHRLASFYRRLDYVLIVSSAEGGPMTVVEGLACGVPIIMPASVGFSDHFEQGIITFEKNNFDSLVSVLRSLWCEKKKLSDQVRDYTMDVWAVRHDKMFSRLLLIEAASSH